ncbi:putative ribonuclease H-like domain-containing protein [Tanacetum coccineum]
MLDVLVAMGRAVTAFARCVSWADARGVLFGFDHDAWCGLYLLSIVGRGSILLAPVCGLILAVACLDDVMPSLAVCFYTRIKQSHGTRLVECELDRLSGWGHGGLVLGNVHFSPEPAVDAGPGPVPFFLWTGGCVLAAGLRVDLLPRSASGSRGGGCLLLVSWGGAWRIPAYGAASWGSLAWARLQRCAAAGQGTGGTPQDRCLALASPWFFFEVCKLIRIEDHRKDPQPATKYPFKRFKEYQAPRRSMRRPKKCICNAIGRFEGRKPALSFMRPFGCPVTILNTIDHLGKFDGKADEGFFVGYSTNSKAFRVFNSRTRIVEENLHVKFSEDTPNIAGSGPNWLFDIDALTNSMNYKPVVAGNQSNGNAGTKACDDAGKTRMETVPGKDYILLPLWTQDLPFSSSSKDSPDAGFKPSREEEKKDAEDPGNEDSEVTSTIEPRVNQEKDANVNNTNNIKTVSPTVNAAGIVDNAVAENIVYGCADDPNMPELEEIGRFSDAEDDISGTDMNNLDTYFQVSPVPTTRIHKDHLIEQIIEDLNSAPQTRRMTRNLEEHGFLSTTLEQRRNHKDIQNCLFACFLSQEEPKKVVQALKDPSWIEAMQEELLQFKLQEVWTLVELPNRKRAIGTKWVFRNKKDERGIVIKNKARLVAQGYTQEEGINYDEVFAPVARIEAIRLFLAYASFKDFVVYQMDVKSAFLYCKIEEEDYVCQPPGFEDPNFPDRVYKVEKALYGLHQAHRAWYETLSTYLLDNWFQRGKIDKTLFIRRDKGDILLVQVYVDDIIFGSTKKSLCTEFEKMIHKKFQISSMGELTFFLGLQVKQKEDGTFISQDKYLKGQPKLGLWYPKDSPFDLVAYIDSDYAGASKCKKKNVVANSTTEAKYIAASNCCGQSAICIVKNPVFHSKKDRSSLRLGITLSDIPMEEAYFNEKKMHTKSQNVADLLHKSI